MSERLGSILSHIRGGNSESKICNGLNDALSKHPDDVVITFAARTPFTKAGKGGLKDTPIDELLVHLLRETITRSKIDPAKVEDICVGNVLNRNAPYLARAAALAAGFPVTTPLSVCNRFCSSGLLSAQQIANAIREGSIDVGLAVGVESMSQDGVRDELEFSESLQGTQDALDCGQPMIQTSENVAGDFNLSRAAMDKFAAESYQLAENAQKTGLFDEEIIPVSVWYDDIKTGDRKKITVAKDDGIRYGTTAEALSKVKPAAPHWKPALTTGGNASQVTDGAGAVLLMRRSTAERLGQPILAKFVGAISVGIPPRIMGIAPSLAVPKILAKTGLKPEDVDLFEINEAFASMAIYVVDKLNLDRSKVNPRGGAIALGHPLGATGARQIVTGLSELRRQKKKVLLTSMCIATGQGMASIIINEM